MICLRCGECCRTMAPMDTPNPCRHLSVIGKPDGLVSVCAIYPTEAELVLPECGGDKRPRQCQDHDYPMRVCPVGMDILNHPSMEQRRADIMTAEMPIFATEEPTP